jgi:branched-chain amino acid transport system ATP-binding protein
LVRQSARLALEISHRSYVFEIGKIALSGDSRSLSDDPRIRKAYLGA